MEEERKIVERELADFDKRIKDAKEAGIVLDEEANQRIRAEKEVAILERIRNNHETDKKKVSVLKGKNAIVRGAKKAKIIPTMFSSIKRLWNKGIIKKEFDDYLGEKEEKYNKKIEKTENKLDDYEKRILKRLSSDDAKIADLKKSIAEAEDYSNVKKYLQARLEKCMQKRARKAKEIRAKFKYKIARKKRKLERLQNKKIARIYGRLRPLMVTGMVFSKLLKSGKDLKLRMAKDQYENELAEFVEQIPRDLTVEEADIATAEFEKYVDYIESATSKKMVESRFQEAIDYFSNKYLKNSIKGEAVTEVESKENEARTIQQQIYNLLQNYQSKEPKEQIEDLISAEGLCRTIGDNELADKISAEINRLVNINEQESSVIEEEQKMNNDKAELHTVDEEKQTDYEQAPFVVEEEQKVDNDRAESSNVYDEKQTNHEQEPAVINHHETMDIDSREKAKEDAQAFGFALDIRDSEIDIANRSERLVKLSESINANKSQHVSYAREIEKNRKRIDDLRIYRLTANNEELKMASDEIAALERINANLEMQKKELENVIMMQEQNFVAGQEMLNQVITEKEAVENKKNSFEAGATISASELDNLKRTTDEYAEATRLMAQQQAKMQYRKEDTTSIDNEIADRKIYESQRNNIFATGLTEKVEEFPPRSR